jgi:cytochrome c oxidase subunit III
VASLQQGSPLAHQFDDLEQQHAADELGMWVFLSTEILLFGALFLTYAVYRMWYEDAFAAASHHANLLLGTINTGVILTSSLFMALAVHAAEAGHRRQLVACLLGTIVFGVAFLGIKIVEYVQDYQDHLMPLFGLPFAYDGPAPEQARIYFNLYFLMTGVHAVHMTIGVGLLVLLTVLASRGKLLGQWSTPVHLTGLYWHFVDVVWVFLYPLLYLIGARWS